MRGWVNENRIGDKLAEKFEFMRREPSLADGIIGNLYDAFGIHDFLPVTDLLEKQ